MVSDFMKSGASGTTGSSMPLKRTCAAPAFTPARARPDHSRHVVKTVSLSMKIIDVFICKLRKKLANASNGKNYIETVWGRGHMLRDPVEIEAKISA